MLNAVPKPAGNPVSCDPSPENPFALIRAASEPLILNPMTPADGRFIFVSAPMLIPELLI